MNGELLNPPGRPCRCGQAACARTARRSTDADLARARAEAHASYRLGTPWCRPEAPHPVLAEAAAATEMWATGTAHLVVAVGKNLAAAINALTTMPQTSHMRHPDSTRSTPNG